MARGILLDTSVIIAHLRGRIDIAAKAPAAEPLFLPLTVLGELYKGVLRAGNPTRSRAQLDSFLKTVAILHSDTGTALHYAQIASRLEAQGTPIPENDIWIAAVAVECSMPLAARDVHFEQVEGLTVLKW